MKILADATLPGLEEAFPKPFELSLYRNREDLIERLPGKEILLCRSTLKVNETLLEDHKLSYVATASSGTDHIDKDYLNQEGIGLIDAKGANAIAVVDYVLACLAFLKKYQGFSPKKAGIIGMGEVGTRLIKRLGALDMAVLFYDPPKAARDPLFSSVRLSDLHSCELLCVHANLHETAPYPSKDLLNASFFRSLKAGTVIINAARGGIVNEEALLQYGEQLIYCTDVYDKEPGINKALVGRATLCTPHIAGHSIEAKYEAINMLSRKLHACYQLFPPLPLGVATDELPALPKEQNWEDSVLLLYNPIRETKSLKSSTNLSLDFKQLRKAHNYRHNFSSYDSQALSQTMRRLLGNED